MDITASNPAAAAGSIPAGKASQPPAIYMIFFTEMWERFSYYGMRALLVLYLVNSVHMPRADALQIYATYTGLVYLTPMIGGYLADRFLGKRKGVLIGGSIMALGHFIMAFPEFLNLALGLLIVGNGFFKANMATLLGDLYHKGDPRRDGGFTIYYMGVNLGAFLGPLIAGYLGEKHGWHWGFAAAGFGMGFGVVLFTMLQDKLGQAGLPAGKTRLGVGDYIQCLVFVVAAIPLVYAVMAVWSVLGPIWASIPDIIKFVLPIGLLTGLLTYIKRTCSREEFDGSLAILILGVFVVFFWMAFEQGGGTMNLFADVQTDRMMFGWEIPATWFQTINAIGIVLLGIPFAMFWVVLDQTRFVLSTPAKMAFGIIIVGLGFVVLAIADAQTVGGAKVGPQWLVIVYLLHTMGELCLSPVGLSMVTKLAPARLVALMMGIWYLANAIANYLAGTLEAMLASSKIPLYWFLVCSSLGAGFVLLAVTPLIKKLLHGRA